MCNIVICSNFQCCMAVWVTLKAVINHYYVVRSQYGVSLNHDGTDGTDGSDGTGIQSVLPVPSASVAGPSVPSVSNSRSN